MLTVSELLSSYFIDENRKESRHHIGVLSESLHSLPVAPSSCEWEVHSTPERFAKTFDFPSKKSIASFIQEILSYEAFVGHDGTHKIDGSKVTVEVYTHDINRITEIDQEYAKHVDDIYRDVLDFA